MSDQNQTSVELTSNARYFTTFPERSVHEQFFRRVFELILKDAVFDGIQRDQPVCRFKSPEELEQTIDFNLGHSPAENQEEILTLLQQVVTNSVKTGHPHFVNQLFSGLDPYGLAGDLVTAALNSSVYTYEVSPVFTLMEMEVFEKMRNIVGFPKGRGDGVMCPGGSIANGYAISCARYRKRPDIKEKGLFGGKTMVMFVSEDSHYSMKKLASFEGLGSDNVIDIKVDSRGKMRIDDLEQQILRAIDEGKEPFLVSATAGTTVLGAFDPFNEIAEICQKYGIWCHVDAAWGGGALMSSTYRNRLKGIEKVDSVTWNPHKLLCAPQQCSVFLLRDDKIMTDAHATHATYLFQKDKFYDVSRYDTGDKYIQCGRRADILKFFVMWKTKGIQGFEQHIDHIFGLVDFALAELKKRPGFHMVLDEPECTNISFWYIPPSLRNISMASEEFSEKIHKVAPKIKERMMKAGSMMVTYQPLRDLPNFFRMVFQSSALTQDDVLHFLDQIEMLGQDL